MYSRDALNKYFASASLAALFGLAAGSCAIGLGSYFDADRMIFVFIGVCLLTALVAYGYVALRVSNGTFGSRPRERAAIERWLTKGYGRKYSGV